VRPAGTNQRGQIRRAEALVVEPAAEIGQQTHVVADRIERISLSGELPAQAVSERRKRPAHHDPPLTLWMIAQVHDCLVWSMERIDQTPDATQRRADRKIMPRSRTCAWPGKRIYGSPCRITAGSS